MQTIVVLVVQSWIQMKVEIGQSQLSGVFMEKPRSCLWNQMASKASLWLGRQPLSNRQTALASAQMRGQRMKWASVGDPNLGFSKDEMLEEWVN